MDPRQWLSNFEESDQEIAHHLLNSFIYFSEDLTLQLFVAAMQNISVSESWRRRNPGDPFSAWPRFFRRLRLTYVTGEVENPTDSGHVFARKARDHAGIAEGRIDKPEVALAKRMAGDKAPLVFVDDFVGSGNQFLATWQRKYLINGRITSFESVTAAASANGIEFETYYAPAVCTAKGRDIIQKLCPGVVIAAGNFLDDRYSAFHAQSLIWPQELAAAGRDMIERVSERLGIPSDGGIWDWRGFHQLGLTLGFAHKTPDATIPLFRWSQDGWHPLVKDV